VSRCGSDLGDLDEDSYLHIHGRVVDCAEIDGRLVTPIVLQDLLCRRVDVRYAVIVLDPATRIAAVLSWPGQTVDLPSASTLSPGRSARRWHQRWWSCPWTGSRSPSRASRTARRSAGSAASLPPRPAGDPDLRQDI
jgi:hypothetical protein